MTKLLRFMGSLNFLYVNVHMKKKAATASVCVAFTKEEKEFVQLISLYCKIDQGLPLLSLGH